MMNKIIRHIAYTLIALSFTLSGCTEHTAPDKVNLHTIDLFFAVADSIMQGQPVAESTWDVLTHSDGYVMAEWHKRDGLIRNAMLIAFHPDSIAQREELLSNNLPMNDPRFHTSLIVRNYVDMQQHWEPLKTFRHNYDFVSMEEKALNMVRKFMPSVVDSLLAFPNVGFICGDPECRSKQAGISLDLNFFYKRPEEGILVLAHEMFHTYRDNFVDRNLLDSNPTLAVIDFIQNEGIADMIDKTIDYDPVAYFGELGYPSTIAELYNEAVASTSAKMAMLDSLTLCLAHQELNPDEYKTRTMALFPLGGHPNGRFLTNLIIANGYREQLLASFADPAVFIRLYNEIAASEGLHMMSDEFMKIIGQ